VSGWHLWLGSEVKRPRCEVCHRRWLVFRYTDGKLDVWACLRHRHVVPGRPER
jgi:transposase-like protein